MSLYASVHSFSLPKIRRLNTRQNLFKDRCCFFLFRLNNLHFECRRQLHFPPEVSLFLRFLHELLDEVQSRLLPVENDKQNDELSHGLFGENLATNRNEKPQMQEEVRLRPSCVTRQEMARKKWLREILEFRRGHLFFSRFFNARRAKRKRNTSFSQVRSVRLYKLFWI